MLDISTINFEKGNGLIPVIAQDHETSKVLMLGFADHEAIHQTIMTRKLTFYSRTKNRLWTKGEKSGNFLYVEDLILDCDQDTVLAKVTPSGPTCHTGADTCWNEKNQKSFSIPYLESIIKSRKMDGNIKSSYIASLFDKGINKIAQKVGEEAVELVIEAKDNDTSLFVVEAADLLFHFLILLQAKDCSMFDVMAELERRHK